MSFPKVVVVKVFTSENVSVFKCQEIQYKSNLEFGLLSILLIALVEEK